MARYRFFQLVLGLALLLAGCDQQALFERFIPKDEAAFAQEILVDLSSKNYLEIEKRLATEVQGPEVRGALEQMAATFPAGVATSVHVVGAITSTVNGITTYNLTFEQEYPDIWLLSNVVLQRNDGDMSILGIHVKSMNQSLATANRFTFNGKGFIFYLFFALTILIPVLILYALVICFRTPIKKRKWLWILFISVGVVECSLNWTDGSYGVRPMTFLLLGAGFFSAGPYAPVIFNIAIPLGAIVFLLKRRTIAIRGDEELTADSATSDITDLPPRDKSSPK